MDSQIQDSRSRRRYAHHFPHKGLLPEGHYYSLAWGIPYEFGGMTTVVLERGSALARQDNRRVEILTLSPEMKSQDRNRELHAEGRIDRRVTVRNLWKDLTAWPDRKLRRMVGALDDTSDALNDILPRVEDGWSEYRKSEDGTVLQIDRYHDRGHLLVSDRLDIRTYGKRGGRRITLFDRSQNVIGRWSTARSFYHAWLDVVFAGRPSYLISDAPITGALIHDYRRANVILGQVMHNHFLHRPQGEIFGELPSGKFEFLCHLDSFDLVTTLTEQQRVDMNEAELSAGNLRSVSNVTENLHGSPTAPRDRRRGGMIARLSGQKRVDDAVKAIGVVRAEDPEVTLDVYGEGTARPMLEALITDLGVTDAVRLHGHAPGAKTNFHDTSFSLLTSRFEGQGLVLLESMSAGCIPIAYDIDYGPADLIDDGVNGFLIPDGDIDACAAAILHVVNMGEDEVQEMRRSAISRAADFFERPIVERWGEVLAEKSFEEIKTWKGLKANLSSAVVSEEAAEVVVDVRGVSKRNPDAVYVSWKARKGAFFGRVPARFDGSTIRASIPIPRLAIIPRASSIFRST